MPPLQQRAAHFSRRPIWISPKLINYLAIHRPLPSAPKARTSIAQAGAGTPAQAWVRSEGSFQAPKGRTKSLVLSALCCTAIFLAQSAEDESLVIGIRQNAIAPKSAASAPKKEWFKSNLTDSALHTESLAAARILAGAKEGASDLDYIKEGVLREKERCVKEFLWMLNWKNCSDPVYRRGAIAGLELCNPEPKDAGKALAISAIFEPDADTRKASIELIKARKDPMAARTLLTTWKSAFDEHGAVADNESTRKAAVDAMREIGDKRVFEVLRYYAMLELRAGSASLARVDTVSIKGQGINLPIDLPVLDLISVEGNIIVPGLTSLKQATGQDFGRHFDKWKDWIDKLP